MTHHKVRAFTPAIARCGTSLPDGEEGAQIPSEPKVTSLGAQHLT